jgi:DNA-binding NarL/FixJ family response regulator
VTPLSLCAVCVTVASRSRRDAPVRRVADLVAVGMTNRDVASAMFLSPKTVEANLSRIYRKLGVHSRAELARHLREQQT